MSGSEVTPSSPSDPTQPSAAREPGIPAPTSAVQPMGERRPMAPATWAWLLALIGWTALLSFCHLDGGAGLAPVEAWVTQPAREMYENISEMLTNRDEAGWRWQPLVIPEFSGETRMQKSPGAYWTVILTAWLRGTPVDEVAARMPNATFAILLVITLFWLTRRIAGDRAAIFAGFAASSSTMVLSWSHGAGSDLGATALITLSLACLWVGSESQPPGWKRNTLWMLGYFCAGLAMLYKMPLPLVCVGLPAFLYVLLRSRWRIFASWWHVLGILLFLLPWLPWALAAMHFEEAALLKWRVEYLDRVTGALPNVEGQRDWYWFFFYVGVALVMAFPYSASIPGALSRPFRPRAGVNRNGLYFAFIWFASLLVFLTVAMGKETRYFLPAMPPLFVLLGIELAVFFDPKRPARPQRDRLGFWAVCVLVPGGLIALGVMLYLKLWAGHLSKNMFTWAEVCQPYAVAAVLFAGGAILAAALYVWRREHASFAALVGTMWVTWLWVWPNLTPVISSQMPFKDFAKQLKSLSSEQRAALRQVAQQDPRYIWYSDVRFPRVIDQLELLRSEEGRRDYDFERARVGEEMVRLLEGDALVLFVASPEYYMMFQVDARIALEKEGRSLPDTYLWIQTRVGREDRRYVVFGNQPPRWEQPQLAPAVQNALDKRRAKLHAAPPAAFPPPATQATATSEE